MIALDLFAGTGWGVACQRLGIEEYGVGIMPEAVATREANGMHTVYHDVWEGLEVASLPLGSFPAEASWALRHYDLLIASPPCQTFSMAGGGKGREALDEVLGLIDSRAYLDVAKLRAFGERHDPRTALVLTPLAHVARDTPTYVVFEQVPPVLPVWERCAEEMRRWGYSVWVGILNAEQYGVPQTRRRAVLIARADGIDAAPPTPTHSRYYSRDPQRLDDGVLPWVSMAEALGWEEDEVAGFARRADDRGAATADGYRARDLRPTVAPGQHVTEKARSWVHTKPASTVVGSFSPEIISAPGGSGTRPNDLSRHRQDRPDSVRVTADEAAALQSYPPGFVWCGTKTKQFLQIGNAVPPLLAEAILKGFTS